MTKIELFPEIVDGKVRVIDQAGNAVANVVSVDITADLHDALRVTMTFLATKDGKVILT